MNNLVLGDIFLFFSFDLLSSGFTKHAFRICNTENRFIFDYHTKSQSIEIKNYSSFENNFLYFLNWSLNQNLTRRPSDFEIKNNTSQMIKNGFTKILN